VEDGDPQPGMDNIAPQKRTSKPALVKARHGQTM
jgi:hypothetical protein